MTYPQHNFDQLKPPLSGFGVHVSEQSAPVKSARIEELRRILLDTQRELEQLLAEGV